MKIMAIARAVAALLRVVRNPDRLDEVIVLADELATPEDLEQMAEAFRRHPRGAAALVRRPRLHLDLAALAALPEGSFGRAFADHCAAAGIDPADLPSREADDPHSYVLAHLYETHDVWHVATGFDTDVAGELGLLAFYMAQFPGVLSPLLLAAGLINTALFSFEDRERRMEALVRGWLLAKRSENLFGVDWSARWEQPLADVQRELGLVAPEVDRVAPRLAPAMA